MKTFSFLLLAFSCAVLHASAATEELKQNAKATASSVKTVALETKDEAKAKLKARIDAWDERLEQLRERARQERGEARAATRRKVGELEESQRELRIRYERAKDSGKKKWNKFEAEADRALEELKASYERLVSELRSREEAPATAK